MSVEQAGRKGAGPFQESRQAQSCFHDYHTAMVYWSLLQ